MFHKFLISLCCMLMPMMFYNDLPAMRKKKKKMPVVAMTKNAPPSVCDDYCCEAACVSVSSIGFGWLAMNASIATESYLRDARTSSAAMSHLWEDTAAGGFVGAFVGEGLYRFYRCLRPKEKQD